MFTKHINDFWKRYSGGKCLSYDSCNPGIRDVAASKGDREMLSYIDELEKYMSISDDMRETWEYPTKEELAERRSTLMAMKAKCKAYRGSRLKGQYALLLMRAQMLLKEYDENKRFWLGTASKIQPGVFRDIMENIYANALLNTGHRQEACDIYARQGDWLSIKWMMRKHRNLAGIKALYAEKPNSPTLLYLVEDFVNNLQETQDQLNTSGEDKEQNGNIDEEWIEEIGRKPIYNEEARQFIVFAEKVLKEKKTQSPCLWQTAIGALKYLMNDKTGAMTAMDRAVKAGGTDAMRDNARCLRLIVFSDAMPLSSDYESFITEEMKWLDGKLWTVSYAEEQNISESERKQYEGAFFYRMKERLVHRILMPKYLADGKYKTAAALLGMMSEPEGGRIRDKSVDEETPWYWNRDYSNFYFGFIDKLNADSLMAYHTFLKERSAGSFELYVKEQVYKEEAYYNDLIGTKLIAEGRFGEAIPFLNKVPAEFLENQNICGYMALRDYSKPRWFERQPLGENFNEGPGNGYKLKRNPKLDFCQEMAQLQAAHGLARPGSEARIEKAYGLAVRFFQASCYGDCWFLTHYGRSISDSARVNEKDFARAATGYLNECKQSKDFVMRQNALYALAFIPADPWRTEEYNEDTFDFYMAYHRNSLQYIALQELNDFAIENRDKVCAYISRCDILREFRRGL